MSGVVEVAVVSQVSPLLVRLKGKTTSTLVQRSVSTVPALSVGERVLVVVVDRQLTFLGRWDTV